jgi:hypothetical protein
MKRDFPKKISLWVWEWSQERIFWVFRIISSLLSFRKSFRITFNIWEWEGTRMKMIWNLLTTESYWEVKYGFSLIELSVIIQAMSISIFFSSTRIFEISNVIGSLIIYSDGKIDVKSKGWKTVKSLCTWSQYDYLIWCIIVMWLEKNEKFIIVLWLENFISINDRTVIISTLG